MRSHPVWSIMRLPAKSIPDAHGPQASNIDGSAISLVLIRFLKPGLDGVQDIKLQHRATPLVRLSGVNVTPAK
jgi:hypothetical protein